MYVRHGVGHLTSYKLTPMAALQRSCYHMPVSQIEQIKSREISLDSSHITELQRYAFCFVSFTI